MAEKGIASHKYHLTGLGMEAAIATKVFTKRVTDALDKYKAQMTELAENYNIPEEKRNGVMATLLSPWAAEVYGFSNQVSERMKSLEKEAQAAKDNLSRIKQRTHELLE